MESTGTSVAQQRNRIPTLSHARLGVLSSSCLPLVPVHNDKVSLMMTVMVQGDGGTLSQALLKACWVRHN